MSCDCKECKTIVKNYYGCCHKGDSNGFPEVDLHYSFVEKLTNHIFFGKPVYAKSVEITPDGGNGFSVEVLLGAIDVEKAVLITGMYEASDSKTNKGSITNDGCSVYYNESNDIVRFTLTSGNAHTVAALITVFYAKTTDEPIA